MPGASRTEGAHYINPDRWHNGSLLQARVGTAVQFSEWAGPSVDTDEHDGRTQLDLYGTLTPAKRMLHPQERAYLLTQPPPGLIMLTHTLQGGKGSAPLPAALHSERVMSISTTALDTNKAAGKRTPPRYMVLYD